MKRMICLLLILALMLPLAACSEEKTEIEIPGTFYYCRSTPVYGVEEGLIAGEQRETAGYDDNLMGLLNVYLRGPASQDLVRPFPIAARVISCYVSDESIFLVISDTFAVLKGVDLTLAMACLTKTIYGLTGIGTLHVKCQTMKLEGIEVATMRIQDIFLLDDSQQPADPE